MREYGKERDVIAKKYDCSASAYYRRRLCAQAKKISFTELPPAKTATELANRTVDRAGGFINETNQKYQISEKASAAATTAKQGAISLWARAKTLVAKNPPAQGQMDGQQADNAAAQAEPAIQEEVKESPAASTAASANADQQ